MRKIFLIDGKLTFLGVWTCVVVGLLLVYLSVEYVPWVLGKAVGLTVGLGIAAVGGYSGQASALSLPPPFTNDPLGWRKAKQSYKQEPSEQNELSEPAQPQDDQAPKRDEP